MQWLPEYVGKRMTERIPQVALGDLLMSEFRQWYTDYREQYPEDEQKWRDDNPPITSRLLG